MKNIHFILLLFASFAYSCASVKNSKVDSQTPISKTNFEALESTFSNYSYESSNKYDHTIWGILFNTNYAGKYMNQSKVKIDFINQKRIRITLLDSVGRTLRERKKGGKFKDGCFYLNRKYMFYPFAPVVFGSTDRIHKLCISDENLSISYAWNMWGFAMINATKSKGSFVSKHRKLSVKK